VLEEKEDYAPYNQLIVECVQWLETTSFNQQTNKRKQVQSFIVKWVTGSPTVNVYLSSYPVDVWSADPDKLMVLFFGGWIRAAIASEFTISDHEAFTEGIRSLLRAYSFEGAPRKTREIRRLLRAEQKGELSKYLEGKNERS
jgi:hypothetical protein